MNKTILFVPGKHPKPPEQRHLELLNTSLAGGLQRVALPAVTLLQQGMLQLASWNFSYYGEHVDEKNILPWIHLMLERSGPSAGEKAQVHHWRVRLAYLYTSLADRFSWLIPYIPDPSVREAIAEVQRYIKNTDNVGRHIREYVKAPLRQMAQQGGDVLVIGHSMGSVIAHDSLWELWHEEDSRHSVDFLTIGSPLGTRYVQHRLQCWHREEGLRVAGNIRQWTNISAEGDLVALDATVADDFSAMMKQGSCTQIVDICENVYNYFRNEEGLNVHRSYGYLVNPVVCKVIADWILQE